MKFVPLVLSFQDHIAGANLPGPGLAIRVMGEITEENSKPFVNLDAILREEIAKAGLDCDIWQ